MYLFVRCSKELPVGEWNQAWERKETVRVDYYGNYCVFLPWLYNITEGTRRLGNRLLIIFTPKQQGRDQGVMFFQPLSDSALMLLLFLNCPCKSGHAKRNFSCFVVQHGKCLLMCTYEKYQGYRDWLLPVSITSPILAGEVSIGWERKVKT